MSHSADFFLGASGPNGFRSYFERSFTAEDGWRVLIIKGGPGTGKSTLMKRICSEAEKRELDYERIWCSSDPSSLDAVIVPGLRCAIFDGTPPHVLEPRCPGVCESIVDLGAAWDESSLRAASESIMRLSTRCSEHHAQCARFLACAEAFRRNTFLYADAALDRQKITRMADRIAHRILKKERVRFKAPSECVRLLSAVTPNGVRFAGEPVCGCMIRVSDNTGAAANELIGAVREKLREAKEPVVCCPCSQNGDILEHLVIPERDILMTTCNELHAVEDDSRVIHAERFMNACLCEEAKQRFSANSRARREMIRLAVRELGCALSIHDELEQYYRDAMDFSAVDDIAARTLERFFAE